MQTLAKGGFTTAQVRAVLHSSGRRIGFRYELLDATNAIKADLDGVRAGVIGNNHLADIKRSARFVIRDGVDSIDYLSDRIRPYIRLRMPNGTILEWPQGVFLLSSPIRQVEREGAVFRDIEAYDQLAVLRDDRIADRWTIGVGVNYISGVNGVKAVLDSAGITNQNLTATSKVTPTAKDWPPGTTKLQIVNELFEAINYRSLWFDEDGRAVAQPYVSPATAPVEYAYRDDHESVIYRELTEEFDLYDVPNRWVLVVSEPDRPPLRSVYTNSAVDSPTSTVARNRTITDYREGVEAADQATLDGLAQRLAFEASQVYQAVEMETAIMPHHSDADVYAFYFIDLGIGANYSEVSWEMDLRVGGKMKHRIRRVVEV